MQLADEIISGALVPGAPLDENTLADRFNVSRTPVREAIRLLVASGLVEVRAHRAAVVARPSADQLAGMFEAMAELEALCSAFAAGRMTSVERRALEDIHDELRVMIQSGDPQRYHEVNEAFHNCYLYWRPQHLSCGDNPIDTGAGAAVSPRAVSQPWSARQVACRARSRGAGNLAWRAIDCCVGDVYAYRHCA